MSVVDNLLRRTAPSWTGRARERPGGIGRIGAPIGVRLAPLLVRRSADALVVALTDAPFLIALLAWSVYYSVNVFRHSEEWGPTIAAAEAQP